MKKILFVFFTLIAQNAIGQVFFDFEMQDLKNWFQYPTERWDLDSIGPISGNYSLHHNFDNPEAGRDRLSFPVPLDFKDTSLTWRFQVRHGYPPSGSNNWGVFLASDKDAREMHPSGSAKGYLVGVNYSGSDDKIKLWRISSGSGYEILDTEFNWQNHIREDQPVGFEIERNDSGLWIVKIDTVARFDRLFEIGRITDTTYHSADYAGIYHEYTASADRKLWFDDFYIGPPIQDTLAPKVTSTHVLHSMALNVDFSETLDTLSLAGPSHFHLTNGETQIEKIKLIEIRPAKIQLQFEAPLTDNFNYKLTISGLQDLSGNTLKDTTLTFCYKKMRVDTCIVLAEDTLLIRFTRATETASATSKDNYEIIPDIGIPNTVCYPSDDPTELLLATGKPFEPGREYRISVRNIKDSYGDSLYPYSGNFFYSSNKAYDIVINEIMADPYPPESLPNAEYIELYNRTAKEIDLTEWSLRVNDNKKSLPSGVIHPFQYIILCDDEYSGSFEIYGKTLALPVFPLLRNSDAEITLYNDKDILIDRVSYHESWYQDTDKANGGYSLERTDPDNHCSGMTNWKASPDPGGGTPGQKNSVFAENIDTLPPALTYFETETDYQVRIRFSEPLSADIAYDVSNYTINNGMGHPYSVILNRPLNNEMYLLFANRLEPDKKYELKINPMSDLCSNYSEPLKRQFTYHPVRPYEVVINEIMADPEPSVGLPEAEYVELYNNSNYEISLRDWKLTLGRSVRTIGEIKLSAGEHCILCDAEFEETFLEYGKVRGIEKFPPIRNSGDAVILENKTGEVISYLNFTKSWYSDGYKGEGGWSLEQIDPDNPCGGQDNWAVSRAKAGGTPGKKNSVFSENADLTPIKPFHITIPDSLSLQIHFNEPYDRFSVTDPGIFQVSGIGSPSKVLVQPPDYTNIMLQFSEPFRKNIRYELTIRNKIKDCAGNKTEENITMMFELPVKPRPGNLVINEVLFNPAFDGVDFVEVYNKSQQTVDLKDVCLATTDENTSEPNRISCLNGAGRLLFPDEYIVYTTNPGKVMEQYPAAIASRFVATKSFPSYPNDAGTVLLINKWSELLDRMDYNEKMHFALLKDPAGVSLERINPDRASDDPTNWQSASQTSGYGTPTYENSQFSPKTESEGNISLQPEVFSPDNDGKDDIINIYYQFDEPGYVATIRIYDSRGLVIRHLINNQTVATEGSFSWDGLDDQRRKAKMGIYVVYMEVFNLQGTVKSFKKTCVVAGRL